MRSLIGIALLALLLVGIGMPPEKPQHVSETKLMLEQSRRSHADIVMLGDSLTASAPWRELLDCDVANYGVGGDTSTAVLARLDTVKRLHPRQVFLMIGVNDIAEGASEDAIIANIAQIARELDGVVVQTVLPVRDPKLNASVSRLNERIRRMGHVLDVAKAFQEDLTTDGVHLTAKGYFLWRDALMVKCQAESAR